MSYQTVRLRSSTGIIYRVIVADLGEVIAVCTIEEYEEAKRTGRSPITVGFKKASIEKDGNTDEHGQEGRAAGGRAPRNHC